MNIYFIIICLVSSIGLGIDIGNHNEEQIKNTNAFASLIARIIKIIMIYFAIKTGF